jgi:hypothetical protein
MNAKPTVIPPCPELLRQPTGRFGWIEDRLLHDGWFARLGAEGIAVLALLALAADRRGASYWGRERMATQLSMTRDEVDRALARLLELRLVAHRPWRAGNPDGVWQLLPVPTAQARAGDAFALGDMLKSLGL